MVQNKGRVLPSEVGEQKALGEEAGRGGGGGGGGARIELELVESRIAPNRDAPISPNRAETRGAR